ncbi:hypothetical protein BGZ63DRAFT_428818 [Mariannaea sp. PMI_226]|nr:hypothetical protein BGZ63DRAFT_428818 [Mariannaea sp. PMI_226]
MSSASSPSSPIPPESPLSSHPADTSTTASTGTASNYKHLQITRKIWAFPSYYDIKEIDGNGSLFMEINAIRRKKPSLTLHTGSSVDGPVVAVAYIMMINGHFKVGFGDPATNIDAIEWEEMRRQNLSRSEYRWETVFAAGPQKKYGERRALSWKRTRSVAIEGVEKPPRLRRNYKLLDHETGEVLAVFTGGRKMGCCGTLELRVDLGETFEQMAIITCMTMYERARRD